MSASEDTASPSNPAPENPQAFPHFTPDGHYNGSVDHEGMTLRDWFAGQMLAASVPGDKPEWMAEHCYRLADAMLRERRK